MTTMDTRITDTPHPGFTGLPGVFLWTRTGEIVECDGAFSSIQTRLPLRRETLRFHIIPTQGAQTKMIPYDKYRNQ